MHPASSHPALPHKPGDFWPRPAPSATLPLDLDYNRPCPHCGYNLRSLPPHHPCPECGSADGRTEFDPLPWERRQSPRAYLATLRMLFTQPDDVAAQLWSVTPLRLRPAQLFRRINLAIAATTFTAVAFTLTLATFFHLSPATSTSSRAILAALLCLPFQSAAILVALSELTLTRLTPYKQNSIPQADTPHFRALTHYLSAGLALSPLHLILLPLSTRSILHHGHPLQSLAMHLPILLLQLFLATPTDARLAKDLLDLPKPAAYFHAATMAPISLLLTGGYLLLCPTFAAFLAHHLAGI